MKYALLFSSPVRDEERSPAEHADDPRFAAYFAEVRAGRVTGGARLRPPADATTVRVRGDEILLSDGPFAETKEYLAGIAFIDVPDLDEAVALAAKHPAAAGGGSVEVRPVWE
ncbi:YciI family protein [Streptomyces sp. NPDC006668]|uniref:YciI family protein n=1 Tax=Streptomyces sp. NPDC006668 TaxID=3156903 RepID=UPI0033FD2339